MILSKKMWAALAAGGFVCGHVAAQEADFDLSSQRSESQDVLPVPGKKLCAWPLSPQRILRHPHQ